MLPPRSRSFSRSGQAPTAAACPTGAPLAPARSASSTKTLLTGFFPFTGEVEEIATISRGSTLNQKKAEVIIMQMNHATDMVRLFTDVPAPTHLLVAKR